MGWKQTELKEAVSKVILKLTPDLPKCGFAIKCQSSTSSD
jgi:hypothetical protein